MQMNRIVLPLHLVLCILEQYCILSFISFVLHHLSPLPVEGTIFSLPSPLLHATFSWGDESFGWKNRCLQNDFFVNRCFPQIYTE